MLAASMGLAQADTPAITRVYVVTVPAAQDHAFNVGVKTWEKCLKDHGAKQATVAYDAETGDISRYLFLNGYSAWSGMDAHDAAGKACMPTFGTQVLPHVGNAFSEIALLNAKETYNPGGDPDPAPMLWADVYRLKAGQEMAFHNSLRQFAAAAAKTHWDGHFEGYDIEGSGHGGEDFVLIWPNKSWADIGQDTTPSADDMMAKVYGMAGAESMHQQYLAAIDEHWSDAWSYDKDLSLIPGK
ncbi:MAG TPA: hypothetical protein VHX12_11375 [Acidisoma sp.]|nr:hypothetical protein [Acidisoma sp.]